MKLVAGKDIDGDTDLLNVLLALLRGNDHFLQDLCTGGPRKRNDGTAQNERTDFTLETGSLTEHGVLPPENARSSADNTGPSQIVRTPMTIVARNIPDSYCP